MPSSFSTSTSILSPAPVSPFSPRTISSSASHYTSDDLPDLGAFATVLREWVHLQPYYPRIPSHHHANYQHLHSHFDPDLEDRVDEPFDRDTSGARSTVWNQPPIADYLHSSLSRVTRSSVSMESDSEVTSSQSSDLDDGEEEDEVEDDDGQVIDEETKSEDEEDTEGSRTVEIADDDDDEEDHDDTHLASLGSTTSPLRTQPSPHSPIGGDDHDLGHEVPIGLHVGPSEDIDIDIDADTDASPSLGYLDEALSFIAAERERARWSAFHGAGAGGLSLYVREEGEWMHVIEPPTRRKKRRGRKRLLTTLTPVPGHMEERISIATGLDNYLNYQRTEGQDDGEIDGNEEHEGDKLTTHKSNFKPSPSMPTPQSQPTPRRPKTHPPNYVYAQGIDSPTTNSTSATTTAVEPVSPSISTSSKSTLKSTPKHKSKSTSASVSVSTPTLISASTSNVMTKSKSKSTSKSNPTSASTHSSPPLHAKSKPKPKLKIKIKTHDINLPIPTLPGKDTVNFPYPYKILTHSRSTPILRSPSPSSRIPRDNNRAKTRAASPSHAELAHARGQAGFLPSHLQIYVYADPDQHQDPERDRLLGLVQVLKGVFPEDCGVLGQVEGRLKVGRGREEAGSDEDVSLDVRGRDPVSVPLRGGGGGDPLIHVFVDHSNILFGLLTYLKRHPSLGKRREKERERESRILKPKPPKPRPPSVVEDEDNGGRSRSIDKDRGGGVGGDGDDDPRSTRTEKGKGTGKGLKTSTLTNEVKGGLLVLGKRARALPPTPIPVAFPIPGSAPGSGSQTQSVAVPATPKQAVHTSTGTGIGMTPIPLPSFATAGRALKVVGGIVSPSRSQSQSQHQNTQSDDGEPGNAKSMSPSKSSSESKGSHLSRAKSLRVGSTAAVNSLGALNTNSNVISASGSTSTSVYGNINDNVFLSSGVARDWGGHDEDGHEGEDEGEESKIKTKTKLGRNGDRGVGNDGERVFERERGDEGDAGGDADADADADVEEEGEQRAKRRQGRRLSHNALALILERGRPITRRVLVTSSPLYQPMDTMERLGYEVRVYMRVPDLGDGMDRERHHKRRDSTGTASGSSGNPKKPQTHARRISGSTSAESASASASTSTGEAKSSGRNGVPRSPFPLPDGTNTLAPPVSSFPHPHHTLGYTTPISSPGGGMALGLGKRVRYREQGVDELLQLKLHQALAATDDVPEGATIVLATGDGNVGQFSEDGFLGPVRTALRRGWKVELYAWEEGLSRAWRREFGEGSEWGRSGMFRVVGMEQFAESLVEGGL